MDLNNHICMYIPQSDTESEAFYVDIDSEYKIIDMGATTKEESTTEEQKEKN